MASSARGKRNKCNGIFAGNIMVDDDILLFAEETEQGAQPVQAGSGRRWKVMIVDDEPEIHTVTRLALSGFAFAGRELELISAYSGEEAKRLIVEHPDTAMVFLDVVMETEEAGLDVVRFIREKLNNSMTRIILRTGQPGQAPERRVIIEYDINDYKTKTELTAQKLFTSLVAGLRAYADLEIIEQNRLGLEQIISATRSIFKIQSMERFVLGVLTQLVSLLRLGENTFYCGSGCFFTGNAKCLRIVYGTGVYDGHAGQAIDKVLPPDILASVYQAIASSESVFKDKFAILHVPSKGGRNDAIYLEGVSDLSVFDRELLHIFCSNIAVAFDNINLAHELERTQKEVVERIGAVAETRSVETGNHVRRVAEYCYLLARATRHGRNRGANAKGSRTDARHRQSRHSRFHPQQAGKTEHGRIRDHEAARGNRPKAAFRFAKPPARSLRRRRPRASRTFRRQRLPARTERQRNQPLRTHHRHR